MEEKKYMIQNFEQVDASELLHRIRLMKQDGYRLGQACATKCKDGKIFILYSFDKDHVLLNLKVDVPESLEIESITDNYWCAFIYENEMHDLFGIKFNHLALDFGGQFFKVSQETPWNPQN